MLPTMGAGWQLDFRWGALAADAEPLFVLLAAILVDGLLGVVVARVPVSGGPFFRFVEDLIRRLNRPGRTVATRRTRGAIFGLVLAGSGAGFGLALSAMTATLPFGWLVSVVVLLLSLEWGRSMARARAVARAFAGGRDALASLPALRGDGQPPMATADGFAASRGAVEHVCGRFADGLVVAVFWFVLLGFPGLMVSRFVARAANLTPPTNPDLRDFGAVVWRLNEALSWLPRRMAALLLVLAAVLVPGASAARAARQFMRGAPSGGAATVLAVSAAALGLSLGGPRPSGDPAGAGPAPWLGPDDGRARADAADARRALYLVQVAGLGVLVVVALVAVARFGP